MTTNADKDLVTYGPFTKGVNSRLEDHEFPKDRLRQAVNVRLRDTGLLERRSGYTQVRVAAVKTHSLYGTPQNGLLLVDGTSLVLWDPVAGTAQVLRTDMTAVDPVAYLTLPGGDVFYSDGRITGRLLDGAPSPWGLAPPAGLLTLSATGGALPAGRYQVAATYVDGSGEEHGAGLASATVLTQSQGISISGFPSTHPVGAAAINLYITPPNGELFYFATTLTLGSGSFAYLTQSATGRVLKTQHVTPPPAGRVLAYTAGRIYIADGPVVWYTEPLQYNRCRRASNFLLFPADVTIMAGVSNGLYTVADKTYWLSGTDPQTFDQTVVLPFGGAKGSLAALADEEDAWIWYSDRGLVKAGKGGAVVEFQAKELTLDRASTGASLFMDEAGVKQIISVSKPDGFTDVAEAQGYIDMEVRRDGKRRTSLTAITAAQSAVAFEILGM